MKDWWATLTPRDQRVLLLGSAALLVILGWLLLWEPLLIKREALREENARLSADLQWMQQVATDVRRRAAMGARPAASRASGGSILSLVEVSASAAGIKPALERIQPEGQGARLFLESISFDVLLRWLGELEQRNGLQVSQLAFEPAAETGKVSARVLLEPAQ